MLDGGKPLAEKLKNLPQRRFVVKSGAERWREAMVPTVDDPRANSSDLLNRSRGLHSLPRPQVEREIAARQAALSKSTDEVLHDWE
jgi:hypothetical protein